MKFELGSVVIDEKETPVLYVPGAGYLGFAEDENGAYVELNREQQLALKKELE